MHTLAIVKGWGGSFLPQTMGENKYKRHVYNKQLVENHLFKANWLPPPPAGSNKNKTGNPPIYIYINY